MCIAVDNLLLHFKIAYHPQVVQCSTKCQVRIICRPPWGLARLSGVRSSVGRAGYEYLVKVCVCALEWWESLVYAVLALDSVGVLALKLAWGEGLLPREA